jgi:hypothetical protein
MTLGSFPIGSAPLGGRVEITAPASGSLSQRRVAFVEQFERSFLTTHYRMVFSDQVTRSFVQTHYRSLYG